MPSKETAIKHTTILATYLLVVWGFYRFLFKLPENIEETIIKPLFWLLPVWFLLRKEKLGIASLGVTAKNLFPSIYSAISMGVVFAIAGLLFNFVKYNALDFSAFLGSNPFLASFVLSVLTAITEEITFRGYIFNRVLFALKDEWEANIIVSSVWALLHIPISVFWWKLSFPETLGIFILTMTFGIGSSYIFARTKNIASSVVLHILWGWPIILFR